MTVKATRRGFFRLFAAAAAAPAVAKLVPPAPIQQVVLTRDGMLDFRGVYLPAGYEEAVRWHRKAICEAIEIPPWAMYHPAVTAQQHPSRCAMCRPATP